MEASTPRPHPRPAARSLRPLGVLAALLLCAPLAGCGSGADVEIPAPLGNGPMQVEVTQVLDGKLVSALAARFRPDTCDERLIARMSPSLPANAPRSVALQLDALPEPARTSEEAAIHEVTIAGRRYLTMSMPSHPSADASSPNTYGWVDVYGSPLVTRRDYGIPEEPDLGLLRLAAGAGVCDRLLAVWEHALVRDGEGWKLDDSRARAVFGAQVDRWGRDMKFPDITPAERVAGVVIERLDVYVDDLGGFRLAEVRLRMPASPPPNAPPADDHGAAPGSTAVEQDPGYLVETWTIKPSRPPVLVQPVPNEADR